MNGMIPYCTITSCSKEYLYPLSNYKSISKYPNYFFGDDTILFWNIRSYKIEFKIKQMGKLIIKFVLVKELNNYNVKLCYGSLQELFFYCFKYLNHIRIYIHLFYDNHFVLYLLFKITKKNIKTRQISKIFYQLKSFADIPSIELTEKCVPLQDELFWALCWLLVFLVVSQTDLYCIRIGDKTPDPWYWLRAVLASNFGTLTEMVIPPVVVSSLVMQLLIDYSTRKICAKSFVQLSLLRRCFGICVSGKMHIFFYFSTIL
ncbi:hypothetical protein RFI_01330 [Reticulomyxa filosa]|uniref:Translocon Sec61/SecY plug domain-containing protein n=1 Tax=Reticulomyxa filosa TaxID=46433 RepID=X6PDI7_RETFI|nr:hypothetical protein RFI_01330 [Reticulomyxa filosa]|eukprot:ETO35732.1 hypothetical protein RFI_01330 [Reticulomyxa filosa]